MRLDAKRGSVWTAIAAIALAGLPGCATSEDPGDAEPNIGSMVVEIDGVDYAATQTAGGFGGTVAAASTGIIPFTVTFFRPGGTRETAVTAADFEVRLASNNAGGGFADPIEFERTGAFTGTISGLEEGGEVTAYFSLYHNSELHTEFGPYFLIIRRSLPDDGGGGGNPN